MIEPDAVRGFAAAVAGADRVPDLGPVPPTFAAVYCLFPTLGQLFFDEEVGLPLDGLVHGEQEFSFLAPVSPGDTVDASAEIAAVEEKRGRTFVTVRLEASRPDGTPVLSGRALLIATGSTS